MTGSSAWVGIPVRASVAWAKPATAYGLKIELSLPSANDTGDLIDATKCSVDVVVSSDAQRHQWLGALARAAQAAGPAGPALSDMQNSFATRRESESENSPQSRFKNAASFKEMRYMNEKIYFVIM